MRKKMMKAIKELNAYIDNDREKLCDELHELKLSHKRMERLLRRFIRLQSISVTDCLFVPDMSELFRLTEDVKRELSYPYLRRNWGYTHKQEPGHYCDN